MSDYDGLDAGRDRNRARLRRLAKAAATGGASEIYRGGRRALRPHPHHLRRPVRSPFFSYLEAIAPAGSAETDDDQGLGKRARKNPFAIAAKSLKGAVKIAGGTIGFKKGLTPSQLKKAGFARKFLIASAAIAAGVVAVVMTAGAAGPFLMSKGALLASAAAKVKAARDKISAARKAAGLPPLHYDRTPQEEVAAAAASMPNAPDLTPEQVTAKASAIAENLAAKGTQVSGNVETPNLENTPEELEVARTEAVSTAGEMLTVEPRNPLVVPIAIAGGVGLLVLVVALARRKKARAA